MVIISDEWSDEHKNRAREVEKETGHIICGYPLENNRVCKKWPIDNKYGRCLVHSSDATIKELFYEKKRRGEKKPEEETASSENQDDDIKKDIVVEDNTKIKVKPILIFFSITFAVIILGIILFAFFNKNSKKDKALFADGMLYYTEGNLAAAKQKFYELKKNYPESKYAYLVDEKLKQMISDHTEKIIKKEENKFTESDFVNWKEKTTELVEAGKLSESIVFLKQVIEKNKDKFPAEEAYYYMANIYQNTLSDYNKSVEVYKEMLEKYPQSNFAPEVLFAIGFINQFHLKNYDEAKKYYNKLINKYPEDKYSLQAHVALSNIR